MSAFNSHFVLIDLHTSWHSATHTPPSAFSYLKKPTAVPTPLSQAFHRTPRRRSRISSSSTSSVPSIRRPLDRLLGPGNGSSSVSFPTSSSRLGDVSELDLFLELVPLRMRNELFGHQEIGELIEVVMDLGRQPLARFPSGDWVISEQPVKPEDLRHAISKVGDFSDDNRSGIDSSLHRISAIRNRKMQIIGLTCRVGRAMSGSAEVIRDLVEGGGSILVIGPPGVGKTTLIRETARMLADEYKKRVVIVDTSNEIGGDGDVPHSGIGRARRMQVPNVHMQHDVMIEAVENHMPETIIIDEIGTELEALAASTIAQRGVQLVGTAHGMTIENIMKNHSLQILVGGIESVTLGDDEARKRKVQKTVLERKGPPTFTCAVEMISRTVYHIHHRLDTTVDALLAGKSPRFEIRCMDPEADCSVKEIDSVSKLEKNLLKEPQLDTSEDGRSQIESDEEYGDYSPKTSEGKPLVYVYTFKIREADLLQVTSAMGLENEIDVTDDIGRANAILVSSSEMKQNPWIRTVSRFHQVPVFVMKSNTMAKMVKAVHMILEMDAFGNASKGGPRSPFGIEINDDAPKRKPSLEEIDALEEVRLAIEYIVIPGGEPVELLPRRSDIVARQLELVERYQLAAENSGTEQSPRLQILPQKLIKKTGSVKYPKSTATSSKEISLKSITRGGRGHTVSRLPLLPE